MRLFMSYARVDKRFCTQLIEVLEAHEIWYDQRLFVGDKWWEAICREIEAADGFLYLVSPDSLRSEFCQKEFRLAGNKGKHIFPVLVHPVADIPKDISRYQYVDMSKGLTVEAVIELLNAILVAERRGKPVIVVEEPERVEDDTIPVFHHETYIEEAARAIDEMNYERAIYLLRTAKEKGVKSEFVNEDEMLTLVENLLEKQSYEREAARAYGAILSLVRRPRMRELGCLAFDKFRQRYSDFDPQDIAAVCARMLIPSLEWCTVPAGEVTLDHDERKVTHSLPAFKISKYPITNAQFRMFIEASDGYCDSRWWSFSKEACQWRKYYPNPVKERAHGDHPRVNISYYEAVAFTRWLSYRTGMTILLPSEAQWQRAAQGDDGRQYPWGSRFDRQLCNSGESKIHTTTHVQRYIKGASPYGAMDMAGNTWEWTDTKRVQDKVVQTPADLNDHAVRGGSYSSEFKRLRNNQRMFIKPGARYATIGFRVVMTD